MFIFTMYQHFSFVRRLMLRAIAEKTADDLTETTFLSHPVDSENCVCSRACTCDDSFFAEDGKDR